MVTFKEVKEDGLHGFSIFKDGKEIAFFLDRGSALSFYKKELEKEEFYDKCEFKTPEAPKLFP